MTTPMMAQWQACKAQAKGALLLFRLGDFYEAFGDDAIVLAKELDIVLTKRQETPMAGIPAHAAENYMDRLVGKGYRVAIAEQMEDPKDVKGLVKREVVRLLTPGSMIQSSLLKDNSSNFMVAVSLLNSLYGVAALDVTTADFRVMEFSDGKLLIDELSRLGAQELLISEKAWKKLENDIAPLGIASTQVKDEWVFDPPTGFEKLTRQFNVHSLDGFGLRGMTVGVGAAGGLLTYALDDLNLKLPHLKRISPVHAEKYLWIDRTTQKHLELVEPLHEKGLTLLSILDTTMTPMGGRLFKEWLLHPLLNVDEIIARQNEVEKYLHDDRTRKALREALQNVRDLERLIMRIETGYTTPRDFVGLRYSLEPLAEVAKYVTIDDLTHIAKLIEKAIVDHPPLKLSEGGIFKAGYHAELDEIRTLKADSQTWLATYQTELRTKLNIKTLKVGYTQAFGYYIEVSRGQSENMPITIQRRQTLVNTERFISPELKEFEHKIYSAEEKITFLENQLFQELRAEISKSAEQIRNVAKKLSHLDVILSFADVAKKNHYVRPEISTSERIAIAHGRHPVIEATIEKQTFVPNDLMMDSKEQLLMITGPNMAGKSTFIRQAALLVLMAQTGSFIPAREAKIGVIDKLFTRIGASDDLSRGQSTFMVEMSETANILHNATPRSLVILDEIGRGTSTYDGIAIAWSVADFLLEKQIKTLFATHYFELTDLEGAVNYNVAVEENERGIVFLHRIVRGSADKSYGIHVAQLAGLPPSVLKKAHAMLKKLHKNAPEIKLPKESQLELF